MKSKKEVIVPFSSGTEALIWYSENCEQCTRAYFPKKGDYPSDKTMKNYVSIGKECRFKYAIDLSFISGEICKELAAAMGLIGKNSNDCLHFSDDKDDGYKAPQVPGPDLIPDNQLLLFSEFDEFFQVPIELIESAGN